jgi:TM2 domain-containing membrane protein YozV
MEKERSHPGMAAVLSFVFNGLGQIYNGQIKKGLAIIFFSSLSMFIFIIGAILIGFWLFGKTISSWQIISGVLLFSFGLVLICVLGIWSIFDAYNVAKRRW